MITWIKDIDIVTLDPSGTVLTDSDLVIKDGRIYAMGASPEEFAADVVVDGAGKVALPGLVNAHGHSPMTLMRGIAEDLPFEDWLMKIWRIESELTAEDVYWGAALAVCEMIRSGTVAFSDHYFHMDQVLRVVQQSGLKASLSWTLFGKGDDRQATGAELDEVIEWTKETISEAEGNITVFLGPHSSYVCPREFLEEVVDRANEHNLGIHLHVAETDSQVKESVEKYGTAPVQFLDTLGVFDVPGGAVAAHCLVLDEEATSILAEKKVFVPHCPITYMKLAMPFPSLLPRLEAGVAVALGTDGPASNSDLDMFATMRQTALINKYQSSDPAALPVDNVLRMATSKRALSFDERGALEIGQPADLILLDMHNPHVQPVHDLIANIVHAAKGSDVSDVMVGGDWLMRARALLTLDEEKIIAESQARADRLVKLAGVG